MATTKAPMAKAVLPARTAAGEAMRIKLDECEFLRLTSAHGEIFEAQVRWNAQVATLQQQAQAELKRTQDAFQALLAKHATAAGIDPARVQRWDKATCELIVDGEG